MVEYDIGIRADHLLTMSKNRPGVRRDHFVGIKKNKIMAVEPWDGQNAKSVKFVHALNKIVMPGLINGHTHLPMSLFRGLADDLPFEKWLHGYILPLESQLVDAEFVRTGTALSALEMIRFGITTVCDSYFFEDVVGDVLNDAGLRGLVSECITDFPTPDKKQSRENDDYILDKMRERFGKNERIVASLAPHAPYSCSDETLKKAAAYAQKHDLYLNIHVSETAFEVNESQKTYGQTPVTRLHRLGVMECSCVFAHCVHITEDDMKLMKASSTSLVHNPESNMKLSAGVAPLPLMMKHDLKIGLGTDGAASNNNLNMFQEMDTAAKLQKLTQHDNAALSATQALHFATLGGAEALGLDALVGSLEVGKMADLIILGLEAPNMQPLHSVESQLVYAATGNEVETVICHGQILFENGNYKTLDREKIITEAQIWRDRIQKTLSKEIT